jgi:ABC-type lipoprotein export system ATPase subunit
MSMPMTAALEARGLYHIYQKGHVNTVALRGAELSLAPASWTTVMGPSGSGKSTLLHILAGLLEPSAGVVTVGGGDVTRLPPARRAEWRRRSVGLVLQRDNLHPQLDAAENIALPLRIQGLHSGEIAGRVNALLQQVGLSARKAHRVGQLSGGEAQRVAIAVALAARPKVLLADEPTGELDWATAGGILDLMETLLESEGMAIMTVTHNSQVTERASRSLAMRDGVLTHAQ